MNSTEDQHALIGHCTDEFTLFYYLKNHLLGSFINSNYRTDMAVNVKEVVLEWPYTHPYHSDARVSSSQMYATLRESKPGMECITTYDNVFFETLTEEH